MSSEWLHTWLLRVKALVRRRELERDLDDELALHVAMKANSLAAGGMSDADANRAAQRRFGNRTELRERTRDEWMFAWLESVWHDLRYGWRTLWRSPGFTLTALLALAFGIGANTAIFSVVHAALLRSAPYEDSDRLVMLFGTAQRQRVERRGASFADYLDWRAMSRSFDDMAGADSASFTLTGVSEPEQLSGEYVSPQCFKLLGIHAMHGRTFTQEEGRAGVGTRVAVISEGLWKRRFGADAAILGRSIRLNEGSYQIVGVMPPAFGGLSDQAEIWVPFALSGFATGNPSRGSRGMQVLARLKPGVEIASAQSEMNEICRRLEREYPDTNQGRGVDVSPLATELIGDVRYALIVLLAAVAFVLLIACANVASLQVARAEARQREIAIRAAIGAGRGRLLRQLTTESCLLAGLGALLGLGFARLAIPLLMRFSPVTFPSWVQPGINLTVAGFTVAVALATGLLLGLAPAVHARLARLHDALKQSSGRSVGGHLRIRQALVAAETALALVLVIGAGLMIRSFGKLAALNPGFDPQGLLTMAVTLPPLPAGSTQQQPVTATELLARISALPGVAAASVSSAPPLTGSASAIFYTAEGQAPVNAANMPRGYIHWISTDYFQSLRTPLVAGRTFRAGELLSRDNTVIVSERVVNRFWPGQDPIGKRIKRGRTDATSPWLTIIGVVPEIRHRRLPENPTPDPDLYFPLPAAVRGLGLIVRTNVADPTSLVPAIRNAIHAVEPSAPIARISTFNELISRQTARVGFTMWLLAIFGAGALILAAVGVYAVLAYVVARRTREIGIRVALGARAGDVLGMVMRQGLGSVAIGLAAGLAAAAALTPVTRRLVYGVSGTDLTSFAGSAAVLVVASVLACIGPAWRACRLDANIALREE